MMTEICAELGERRVAVLTGVSGEVEDSHLSRLRIYRARNCFPPRSATQNMRLIAALSRAIAIERPAVLQYASLEDAYLAYWTHKVLRLKHLIYAHGNELLDASNSGWRKPKVALLASSCVVACSRYTAGLVRNMGLPNERIRVVNPGCDVERFFRMPVGEGDRARLTRGRAAARILVTVGNLVERKGHDTVLKSLTLLRSRGHDVLYLIAGDGPNRAQLERLAASLGVLDRVVFLGRVAQADLPLLYSMADLFVMVSRERPDQSDVEGFGIVFLEASACGTPVVGGRSGGIEDAVVDDITGLLVDPVDAVQLARAIDLILSDRGLARRLGEAGMRRAVSEFSWSRHGKEIAAILEEIVQGRL